ncbi:RNA polymerase-binding transcription factor DksA [Conyzicola lurida]|uniref:RNA polymerase-binding transcription factor DksA n=1 Tax=Conyzicola lurida TaxID=1172621 RepID=A0A841AEM2_9MICO|nr:TraR/DksA C4-type zinc finger protein [Conyzicola lurida]MBB5841687.1 RNA polymerase-binding transcription factor DksA [Conyzicola lurida]
MTSTAPDTATLTSRQRSHFRKRLDDDRTETAELIIRLDADVASFHGSRAGSSVDDEHDPEGPTLAFEQSQASAILEQTRVHLSQIDKALERLEAGTFGSCVTCLRPIPVARLEARPYSTQCVACASVAR